MIDKGLLASGLMASQLLLAPMVYSAPEGGVVVSGSGSVSRIDSLNTSINQQSQNLLMNFDSFDVAVDEAVLISQPNAAAWFVGKIVGGSPTAIFGSITANGQIALVNPRGIIFGDTARVDAASLFASSLDLNTENFKKGDVTFRSDDGPQGMVINQGIIQAATGGSVTLLGEVVANQGTILANLGYVNMASGREAVVSFGPENLLGVQITEEVLRNSQGIRAAVENSGTIDAAGGHVLLTGEVSRSLFDHAVNNEGIIKASRAEHKDGVIKLFGSGSSVLNTGVLDASNQQDSGSGGRIELLSDEEIRVSENAVILATSENGDGGTIHILGNKVGLLDNSVIDVSGGTDGGTVNVGRNQDDSGSNAERVYVGPDVTIVADAGVIGNGGTVTISADEATLFSGTISAKGGIESGDGGTVAISGQDTLIFDGFVDTTVTDGAAGSLQLISSDIVIDDQQSDAWWPDEFLDGGTDSSGALTVRALENVTSTTNLDISADSSITINDLAGNALNLAQEAGSTVSFTVNGNASGVDDAKAIRFLMQGADDTVSTNSGSIAITTTDISENANALIEIGGRIESNTPVPLPDEPDSPAQIALLSHNGRIRIRETASIRSGDTNLDAARSPEGTHGGSILIAATGWDGTNDAGTVYLSGELDVSSETGKGGTANVLGDRVGLLGNAAIDASGLHGGGQILVGGNFQGKGEEANARLTLVEEDVELNADAIESGDGGQIVIWADDTTQYFGSLSARGGLLSGDGGFAEVSGKKNLVYRGYANLDAPEGQLGDLLLDPENITISAGLTDVTRDGGTAWDNAGTGTVTVNFTTDSGTTLLAGDLVTQLNGVNVILQATDDITVDSNVVTAGSDGDLTLQAGDNINVNADIQLIGASTLSLQAGATTPVSKVGNSDIVVNGGVTLSSASGAVSLSTADALGAISIGDTSTSTVNVTTTGSITFSDPVSLLADLSTGGSGATTNFNDVLDGGKTVVITGAGVFGADVGGITPLASLSVGGTSSLAGNIATSNGLVNLSGATTLTDAANVVISTGSGAGDITFGSSVVGTTTGFAESLSLSAGSGTISATGAIGSNDATDLNALVLSSIQDVSLTTHVTNLDLTTDGSVSITGNSQTLSDLSLTLGNTAGKTFTFTTFGGNEDTISIVRDGTKTTFSNSSAVTANITLEVTSGDLEFGTSDLGSLTATSPGSISQSGVLSVSGISSFHTTANDASIDLSTQSNVLTGAIDFTTTNTDGTPNYVEDVTLVNTTAVDLNASSIAGDLSVTATAGGIVDSGTVAVARDASFISSGENQVIDLGTLNVTGNIALATTDADGAVAHASVVNVQDVNLDDSDVQGNLTVTTSTAGGITDTAAATTGVVVKGNAVLISQVATEDIVLNNLNVTGNMDLSTTGAGADATVVNAQGVAMDASEVVGNLSVTATTGNIIDNGLLNVDGTASFATLANDAFISLGSLDVLGKIDVTTTNTDGTPNYVEDVTLVNTTAVDLNASSIAGDLSVTATAGGIVDSGTVAVARDASFISSGENQVIDLGTLNVTGNIALATTDADGAVAHASVVNVQDVNLDDSDVQGNLTVTTSTAGGITDTAAATTGVVVKGNAVLISQVATEDIVLNNLNVTGNMDLSTTGAGADATVVNAQGVALDASEVVGNLSVTATTGNIIDNGLLNVDGTSSFATLANDAFINLGSLDVLGKIDVTTTNTDGTPNYVEDVTLVNTTAVDLNASSIAGDLSVTATAGGIVDSGTVAVARDASFISSGENQVIDLGTLNVTGNIALATTDADGAVAHASVVNVQDVNLDDSNVQGNLTVTTSTAGGITDTAATTTGVVVKGNAVLISQVTTEDILLNNLNVTGNMDLSTTGAGADATVVNAQGVALDASEVVGNLSVTATTGNITDNGLLNVDGTASFATLANDAFISLGSLDVLGKIDVTTTNTDGTPNYVEDVTLVNTTAVDLNASSIAGDLSVTATAGGIVDSGTVAVARDASFISSGENQVIDLGTLNVTGNIALATTDADGAVAHASVVNVQDVNLDDSNVQGNLTVTTSTAGGITDTAAATTGVVVKGNAVLISQVATEDIVLNNLNVTGNMDLSTTGAGADATVVNAQGVALDASEVVGNLSVTATTGNITDNGLLNVDGTASFATLANDAFISLGSLDVLGKIDVTTTNTDGTPNYVEDVTLVNTTAVDLNASSIAGDLSVTAATGNIIDSGLLNVDGTASFATLANDAFISLGSLDVLGKIDVTTTNTDGTPNYVEDVTLVNTTAVDLNASSIAGDLSVTATAGGIVDSGTVAVARDASFISSGENQVIDLGTLNVTGNIALATTDADGAVAHASVVNVQDVNLDDSNVQGNLTVTTSTAGGITDTAAATTGVVVKGNAVLISQVATEDIVLNNLNVTGNMDLSTTGAGADATVVNAQGVALDASEVVGNLSVTAITGNIDQNGILAISGTSSFATTAADQTISLTQNNQIAGEIDFSTSGSNGNVSLTNIDAGGTTLAASGVNGSLAIVSSNAIDQSGFLTVSSTSSFETTAADQSIDLSTQNNLLTGDIGFDTVTTAGNNNADVSLSNTIAGTTTLSASTIAGDLTLSVQGGLADSGIINLAGKLTFVTTDGDALLDTVNAAGEISATTGATISNGDATIVNTNASGTVIGTTNVAGKLDITSSGQVTQTAAISATDLLVTTLNDAGAGIILDDATNSVSSAEFHVRNALNSAARDANIAFKEGDGYILMAIETTGTSSKATLDTAGAVTGSGTVAVSGLELLGSGSYTLNAITNDIDTLATNTSGTINFVDSNSLVVGTVTNTSANSLGTTGITSGGNDISLVSSTGGLTINEAITAGAADISLSSATGTTQSAGGNLSGTGLVLLGAGAVDLTTSAGNALTNLAANTSNSIKYTDNTGLTVGSILVNGVTTTGLSNSTDVTLTTSTGDLIVNNPVAVTNLALNAAGSISQGASGTLTVTGLAATATAGSVNLSTATNDVTTLAASAGTTLAYDEDGASGVTIGTVTVNAVGKSGYSSSGNASLSTQAGPLTLNQAVNTGTNNLTLNAAGAVTQGASGTITAGGLELLGAGPYTLTNTGNSAGTLAALTSGAVQYTDTDALIVGSVLGTNGINSTGNDISLVSNAAGLTINQTIASGAGDISLSSATGITQSAGGNLSGTGLVLLGAGAVDLTTSAGNALTNLAANTSNSIKYTDNTGLTVGSILVNGVTTTGLSNSTDVTLTTSTGDLIVNNPVAVTNLALNAAGSISQGASGTLTVTGLAATATAGSVNLSTATNDVTTLAASAGTTLDYDEDGASGVTIGTVTVNTVGKSGYSSSGNASLSTQAGPLTLNQAVNTGTNNLTLNAAGAVTQGASGTITAGGLELLGTGPYTLTNTGNSAGTLAALTSGAVQYTDTDALIVGSVLGTNGINSTGNDISLVSNTAGLTINQTIASGAGDISLGSATGITQSAGGNLSGTGLVLLGAGAVDLTTSAGNALTNLAANTGSTIRYTDNTGLTVGSILVNGVTTTGLSNSTDVTLTTSTGDLIVNNPVAVTNLALNAAGSISQGASGTLTVTGLAATATAGSVNLSTATNDVTTLAASAGTALDYDEDDTGGSNLVVDTVTVNAVAKSGYTGGSGTASLTTQSGSLTLNQAVSTLTGSVTIASNDSLNVANNVTVSAGTGTISLHSDTDNDSIGSFIQQTGNISTNSGAISITGGGTGDIRLGAIIDTGGQGILITNELGSILENSPDSSALSSVGIISLLAGNTTPGSTSVGNTTDAINTNAGTLTAASGTGGIYINNTSPATTLGAMTVTGDFSIVSIGDISQTGMLTISGDASFNAGINDIDLRTGGFANNFGSLSLTGNDLVITEAGGTELSGVSSVNVGPDLSSLDLISGGAITESGAAILAVSGNTIFNAGANNIVLDGITNDFNTLTIAQAADVTITDATGIDLLGQAPFTISGDLAVTVDADDNASDPLKISGALNIGGDVILSGSAVQSDTVDIDADVLSSGALVIQNANLVDLADGVDLEGSSISVSNSIGTIFLSGSSSNSIKSTAGSIDLDNTVSNFSLMSLDSGAFYTDIAKYTGGGDLQVVNSDGVVFAGEVTAGTVTLTNTDSGDSIAFRGNTNIDTLDTTTAGYVVEFTGNSSEITTIKLFENTGGVIFGDSSIDSIQFTGGLTVSPGVPTTAAGTISTLANDLTLDSLTIADNKDATLSTSGANLTITGDISGVAAGAGDESITFNPGSGNLNLSASNIYGAGTAADALGLTTVRITNSNDNIFASIDITGSLTQVNPATGLTTFNQPISVGDANLTGTTFQVLGDIQTVNGFLAIGDVQASSNISAIAGDIDISGDFILNEGMDLSLQTTSGSISISGTTHGTVGSAPETLVLDAGTGSIQLGDVSGSASVGSITGLTDLTITNSSGVDFNNVDITGQLIATATGGQITQNPGTTIKVGGNSSYTASVLDFGDAELFGTSTVTLAVTNDATIINNNDLVLQGSVGGDLVAEASQAISQITDNDVLTVGGTSTLTADTVVLDTLWASGTISLAADDATISNNQATIIQGNVTTNLSLVALAGSITDAGPVTVGDLGIFTANAADGSITLDNLDNAFGRLSLSSTFGNVKVREVDSTQIENLTAASFDLTSADFIQDGTNSTLTVTGLTTLSSPVNITLGNDPGDNIQLGSLDLTGNAVVITDRNPLGVKIKDADVASLSLITQGPISSLDNSIIRITNQALLNAASGSAVIDLASALNTTNTFGSLSLTGSNVQVREQDDTRLVQVTAGGDFSLFAGGEVFDIGVLTIAGRMEIDAGGKDITLDSSTNTFGQLDITGGDVEIEEDDASELVRVTADSFTLNSGGDVTELVNAPLNVDGLFTVDSGLNQITLPGLAHDFGSVNLTGSDILIREANATRLEDIDANTLDLTSGGNVTQLDGASIDVLNLATFSVGTNNITLQGATNTFGSLHITGNSVKIAEADNTTLAQVTVDKLTITSVGSIDASGALTVSDLASFSADDGAADITLDSPLNAFGSLSVLGGDVLVEEGDGTLLVEVDVSTLDLNSDGNITDDTGADISVSGAANLVATGDINIGDDQGDTVQFGITNLTGNAVNLTENNSTNLGDVTASSLSVNSTSGAITQTSTSVLDVSGAATFHANDITLDTGLNSFGSLDLEGDDVVIEETDGTQFDHVDVANLTLQSGGAITDSGSLQVDQVAELTTSSNITLDASGNSFGSLDLEGAEIDISETNSTTLDEIDATTLTITSGGSIDDGLNASIVVSGGVIIAASGDVTLGDDSDDTIRFGNLDVSGNAVEIRESDDTLFSRLDVTSLDLFANGDILQQDGSVLTVTDLARLNAQDGGGDIILDNGVNNFGSVDLTGAIVRLLEQDDTEIAGIDANQLDIDSGGSITQTNGAVIRVSGTANFTAVGDIELNEDNQFGSLGLDGDTIKISGSDDIVLSTITAIEGLEVFSEGSISQEPNSELEVANKAAFNAGNGTGDISLDQKNSFGSVELIGNIVELIEINDTQLDRVVANSLDIDTPGDVTNGFNALIRVQGKASFDARDISLGDDLGDSVEFGSVDFIGRNVSLTEFDSTLLGIVDVETLTVTSFEEIEQTSNSLIDVVGLALFNADNGDKVLDLSENNNDFGSLSLTGSDVFINEQYDTNLLQADADNLTINSDGDIFGEGIVRVSDTLFATADGGSGDITIENALNEFGRLDLEGSVISIIESGNSQIDNIIANESFSIQSSGRISDGTGEILVENSASFIAEDNVTLGENGIFTVGSLNLSGLEIEISEADDTLLTSLEAESLDVFSGGDIDSEQGAIINVLGRAKLTADDGAGSIDLSTSTNTFGSLDLTGNTIEINEADDTLLDFVQSDDLSVISGGSITDSSGSTIEVSRDATLSAIGDVELGDELNDLVRFGTLGVTGVNVTLSESDSTVLSGLEVSGALELLSTGSISSLPDTILVVSGSTLMYANEGLDDITLDQSSNSLAGLDLHGSNIAVTGQDVLSIQHISSSATTELLAPNIVFEAGSSAEFGHITVTATESISVGGDLTPHSVDNLATLPGGSMVLAAPVVTVGTDGGAVELGTAGGPITITGLNETGDFTSAALGRLELLGTVTLDTTYNNVSEGAQVNLLSDVDGIGEINASAAATGPVTLAINAGSANIEVGNIGNESPIANFTVSNGFDLNMNDLNVAGNSISIDVLGAVNVQGMIVDSEGDIVINSNGDQTFVGDITAIQGSVSLKSVEGSITTQEVTSAGGSVFMASRDSLILGTNTMEDAIVAGSDVIMSASNDILVENDVTAGGDVAIFSFQGEVIQAKDTLIKSAGELVLSAETGMTISQLESDTNVTLVITATTTDITDPVSFARANDPVPPGQGDASPDIRTGGTIVFLAPVADVGGTENDQNFVQRADTGIFYGLDTGKFFSDDIGTAPILNNIPSDTQSNLNQITEIVLNSSSEVLTELDGDFTVSSSLARIDTSLSTSRTATADAGDTSFKSSSKSTAASQRDDEEEVTEVDETAFQNLTNYEDNPQGIMLPQDQQFAYDDQGNIYYLVRYEDGTQLERSKASNQWKLYKVKFTPSTDEEDESMESNTYPEYEQNSTENSAPVFIRLTMVEHGAGSGED